MINTLRALFHFILKSNPTSPMIFPIVGKERKLRGMKVFAQGQAGWPSVSPGRLAAGLLTPASRHGRPVGLQCPAPRPGAARKPGGPHGREAGSLRDARLGSFLAQFCLQFSFLSPLVKLDLSCLIV